MYCVQLPIVALFVDCRFFLFRGEEVLCIVTTLGTLYMAHIRAIL